MIKASAEHRAWSSRAKAVWGSTPAGHEHAQDMDVREEGYFDRVRKRRNEQEMQSVLELAPFRESANKKVLEIGCGAGYDAVSFVEAGAVYTGVDVASENIERTRRNLGGRAGACCLMVCDVVDLPFSVPCFDVAYSNGVLHHVHDIGQALRGISECVKENGVIWIAVYHKWSLFYVINLWLLGYIVSGRFLRMRFRDLVSTIEMTSSSETPLVNVYSRREVRGLLEAAGFVEINVKVRKLVVQDLPLYALMPRVMNCIPSRFLEFLGRFVGWYVVATGRKAG